MTVIHTVTNDSYNYSCHRTCIGKTIQRDTASISFDLNLNYKLLKVATKTAESWGGKNAMNQCINVMVV